MLFKKNEITICVDSDWMGRIQYVVDKHVNTKGVIERCVDGGKMYETFKTNMSAKKVAKVIEERLCECTTKIMGNVIFVDVV